MSTSSTPSTAASAASSAFTPLLWKSDRNPIPDATLAGEPASRVTASSTIVGETHTAHLQLAGSNSDPKDSTARTSIRGQRPRRDRQARRHRLGTTCHFGGRGFESRRSRSMLTCKSIVFSPITPTELSTGRQGRSTVPPQTGALRPVWMSVSPEVMGKKSSPLDARDRKVIGEHCSSAALEALPCLGEDRLRPGFHLGRPVPLPRALTQDQKPK